MVADVFQAGDGPLARASPGSVATGHLVGEARTCGPPFLSKASGGAIHAPCPIAVRSTDNLEARIAVAFLGDPQLCGGDRLGQMQKLRVAANFLVKRAGGLGLPSV